MIIFGHMKRLSLIFAVLMLSVTVYGSEFHFGSYNIRVLNNGDGKHYDGWTDRCDVMCDLIAALGYDAFGAQEVTRRQLTDMLDRLPEYGYVGVGRDDGKEGGEYSPVFYRKDKFKVLESGTFWLSESPEKVSFGWDAACRRVCSYAKLKNRKTKEVFWFFNTHMDHIGITARREGARLILAKIHEIAGDEANVVLTGDFNVDQRNEAYSTIISTERLVDSYWIAKHRFCPGPTFNNFVPTVYSDSRIDHVFVSNGSKVSSYMCLTAHYWRKDSLSDGQAEVHLPSDHYPLSVRVDFGKKK